jgi:hypothetical protein
MTEHEPAEYRLAAARRKNEQVEYQPRITVIASSSAETVKSEPITSRNLPQQETADGTKPILALISKLSGNRMQDANQDRALTLLNGHGMEPELIDGSYPANKDRRSELFGT